MGIEERVDLLEFQAELLFNGKSIDRLLYESRVTRAQWQTLMDLLEEYRKKIGNGEKVYHGTFEDEVYRIVPQRERDYHFCESLARLLMEDGRWEKQQRMCLAGQREIAHIKEKVERNLQRGFLMKNTAWVTMKKARQASLIR